MTATIGLTGGAGTTASININGSPVVEIGASGINTGININGQTVDATPDGEADYLLSYDASAAALKKILLNKATAFKVMTLTRNLTTASGTQVVTGVGFKPKMVVLLGAINGVTTTASWGFDDGTTDRGTIYWGATVYGTNSGGFSIGLVSSASNYQTGGITSMDSDGFTISWTKNNSPTGTADIYALCLR